MLHSPVVGGVVADGDEPVASLIGTPIEWMRGIYFCLAQNCLVS
jgi:hypothetical protein